MYAQAKVTERLSLAAEALSFTPEYHSVSEVEGFESHLIADARYTYDDLGKPNGLQSLDEHDRQWILNEQTLCACDAAYWITRYGYLIDEEGTVMRFRFRMAQRILFDIISDLELQGFPIEVLILKARQLGMTSLIQLLIGHRIFFGYGVNAVAGSADQQKTGIMASKMLLAFDMMPIWMQPKVTRRVESDRGMLVFGGTLSGVSFQHGAQMSGIARGTTPTIYHLCISGKTLIRVRDGRVVPMREVTTSDFVLTIGGEQIPVRKAWKSPRACEMTSEICVWGTPSPLSSTRDHLVLTSGGWRSAKDVTSHDWLIYPVRPIRQGGAVTINRYGKYKHKSSGAWSLLPSFELGRIVGLYLAEGCIFYSAQRTPVVVGFAIHQEEDERVRSWIQSVFPNIRATNRRKNSKTAIVSLPDRGFAEWLIENFGTKDEKRISDLCWYLGRDFCRGLVNGYIAGDGHYSRRDNAIYATSVRVAISLGLRELIASLGYGWSQISFREKGIWYNRNCRDAWILVLAADTAEALRRDFGFPTFESGRERPPLHWRWHNKTSVAVEVERVAEGFSEDFYDIEVEHPEHAFSTVVGVVHNSEVASFTDAQSQIEDSLFKCVHPSTKVFGALESTGEGDKGWWPDTWRKSRDTWPRSRLCPLFLPWFCGIGLYPKAAWLRKNPVPLHWTPNRDTTLHTAKSELYVRSSQLLAKALGRDWHLPREQQYWWEVEHEQAKLSGGDGRFLQEYCGDDEEALQMSITSVFGHKAIATINERRKSDYAVYGFSGQSIEDAHEPPAEDIDYDAERLPVKMTSLKGETHRWELIPLRFRTPLREQDPDDAIGKLFIFHPPAPGIRYAMGIDTSAGMGLDSTCISVWGIGQKTQPDFQAAEFTSPFVSHVEAYAFGACIGAYYAKYMSVEATKYPMPYCAVEQVAAVGDTCQLQMIHLGYPLRCFHKMVRYDNTPAKIARQRKGKLGKLGWFTWPWSRPILIDNFVHSAQNGWAEINSPWLIEEMKHFQVRITSTGKEKMEHAEDSHDDRIFAAAMPIFCAHDMDSLAERSKKRLPDDATALPPVDIAPYAGQVVSAGELREPRALTLQDILYGDTSSLRRHSY